MAEFLRGFKEKNTTSAEKAKAIRDEIRGYRQVLVIDHENGTINVGSIGNLVFLPKRRVDHDPER